MSVAESKNELRRNVQQRVRAMTQGQRTVASQQACSLLEMQSAWKIASTIFFYAPLPEELDIWPLVRDSIAAGKTVALPRFDSATQRYVSCQVQDMTKDLSRGQFGIR